MNTYEIKWHDGYNFCVEIVQAECIRDAMTKVEILYTNMISIKRIPEVR